MSRTYRRDKLLRQAKAGKLFAISGYRFDDMFGVSKFKGKKRVHVYENNEDIVYDDNVYNVHSWDFSSTCGLACINDEGAIHLYVHSNCNHTFIVED